MIEKDRLSALISTFPQKRVLVFGDVMLDRFIYGRIERISPEAPVPVLSVVHETAMPGGAANVARNIASLGGQVVLVGAVGADEDGKTLSALLNVTKGIESRLITVPGRPTITKVRYIAEAQQVVRVDREERLPLSDAVPCLLALLRQVIGDVDIVVLSDYAKGILCDEMVRGTIALAQQIGKRVVVDPKSINVARYDGATVITPNLREAAAMAGMAGHDNAAVAMMAQAIFAAVRNVPSLVITRSGDGMTLAERNGNVRHFPVVAREVADVSGAGDTVVAALGLGLAAGGSLSEAVQLANVAAGIAVGKTGTAEVFGSELAAALQSEQIGAIIAKTADFAQASALAAQWRREGLRVGFTNGCFDLIHPGHVSLLRQAKSHCDRLIVGLNTDASVRRLKGPNRPVQEELSRALVLGALAAVDLVVLFDEDTPIELIRRIHPDVLVKGEDYRVDQVVGADFVRSYGGKVVLAELTPNQSTTGIISRIDEHSASA